MIGIGWILIGAAGAWTALCYAVWRIAMRGPQNAHGEDAMQPCANPDCGLPAEPLWKRGRDEQSVRKAFGLAPDACVCDACWQRLLWTRRLLSQRQSKGW